MFKDDHPEMPNLPPPEIPTQKPQIKLKLDTKPPNRKSSNTNKLTPSRRRSLFMSGSPLYGEVSNKMNMLFSAAKSNDKKNVSPNSISPVLSYKSSTLNDSKRHSNYSNISRISTNRDDITDVSSNAGDSNYGKIDTNTSPLYFSEKGSYTNGNSDVDVDLDVDVDNDDDDDENGMFDNFSFDKMIANRHVPVGGNKLRIVSDPIETTKNKQEIDEMSKSLPIGKKPQQKQQQPQINVPVLIPKPLSIPPMSNSKAKSRSATPKSHTLAVDNSPLRISTRSTSPLPTQSTTKSSASSLSRSNSVHSRKSIQSNSKSHRRSSSKGSIVDIGTPKSFFKFFSGKKHDNSTNVNTPVGNRNSYSSFSQYSDSTHSIHSGISPTLSNYEQKDINTTLSSVDTLVSSNTTAYTNRLSTSMPMKTIDQYELKSRSGSIKSSKSSKSINLQKSQTLSSSSSNNLRHKPTKSSDSNNSNRSSIYTVKHAQSAGTTPTASSTPHSATFPKSSTSSASTLGSSSNSNNNANSGSNSISANNSTMKVRSLVKLGSKSIKYSRTGLQKSSLDDWDGYSGSFEKIGPVGKKPSPYGQTISVVTTSNLHGPDSLTQFEKVKRASNSHINFPTSTSAERPKLENLSSSSLPALVANNENFDFMLKNAPPVDEKNYKADVYDMLLANEKFDYALKRDIIENKPTKIKSTIPNVIASNENFDFLFKQNPLLPPGITVDGHTKSKPRTPVSNAITNDLNSKFLPLSMKSFVKVLVTLNFIDYKYIDISNFLTLSKFISHISTTFRIKDPQFYITDIGLKKDRLGKKLDKKVLQSTWDGIINADHSLMLVFYVSPDDSTVHTSPHKLTHTHSNQNANHEIVEEHSIYTNSSYTNSIYSDSSFDKNLPTPQHLISTKKESSVDYWSFNDAIERKPSLNRAVSVTHSSLNSENDGVHSSLSHKTSKTSLSSVTQKEFNPKLKGSFKIILPSKPHVDFDNKRSTPFVAQRQPPPLPITQSGSAANSTGSSPSEKPLRSRKSRKMPPISNSIRSLQRSNTAGSMFSSLSGSSGVSVDPFTESTKIAFESFDSDTSSGESSDECDEDMLFAKKPKSLEKNVEVVEIKDCEDPGDSDDSSDDSDGSSDLFFKKPKSLPIGKIETTENETTRLNDIIESPMTPKSETHFNENGDMEPLIDSVADTVNNDIIENSSPLSNKSTSSSMASSLDIRPPPEVLYNNLEVFFPKADLDSLIINDEPDDNGFGRMKSIRIIANEAKLRGQKNNSLPIEPRPFRNSTIRNTVNQDSLLRRGSTKMWGQKVVEVKLDSRTRNVIPRRNKNGEFEEFAWIKGEMIGIGKFGRVYVALNVTTGELIAVKQIGINKNFIGKKETEGIVDTFKAEVDSLKDLDHVNIVQYLGFEIKDTVYSIFLEYVAGGSIGHLLRKYGRFDEDVVRYLTEQALEGLNYIHRGGILHRDLKADNMLLEPDGTLKISDFGISKRAKDIYTSQSKLNFQGTIFWMAPEIINDANGSGYNAKVDIWALGCVVIEMFTGERPWSKYEAEGVMYKIAKEKRFPPIRKDIRKDMTPTSKDFLRKCFELDPIKRPTAKGLLENPFCKVPGNFDFTKTAIGKKISEVEDQEKDNLNKRMHSMARKM